MNIIVKITSIVLIQIITCNLLVAQDLNNEGHNIILSIPEVALLNLEATVNEVVFTPNSPNSAGLALDFSNNSNNNIWINYSSVVSSFNQTRKVNAAVIGDIPEGLLLMLDASADVGRGNGQMGIPTGEIILSNEPQDIITNIGSCYTGEGLNRGHMLSYSLKTDPTISYSALAVMSTPLTVTFTITEEN